MTKEEQERDDVLAGWLKELRLAHPTAFASIVVQCPDGSYHHTVLSSPDSAYAAEHQRVAEAICAAILVACEDSVEQDPPVH
jgi:hypothetical protein